MGNTTSISDPKPVLPRSKRVLCKDQCKCSSEEKKRQREKCMQFKESWMFTNHYKLFASTNRVLCEIYEKMSKFGLTEIDYSLREDSKVELPKDKGYKINSVLILCGPDNGSDTDFITGWNVGDATLASILTKYGGIAAVRKIAMGEIDEPFSSIYEKDSRDRSSIREFNIIDYNQSRNFQESIPSMYFVGCSYSAPLIYLIQEVSSHLKRQGLQANAFQIATYLNTRFCRFDLSLIPVQEQINGTFIARMRSFDLNRYIYHGEGVSRHELDRISDIFELSRNVGLIEAEAKEWLPCGCYINRGKNIMIETDELANVATLIKTMHTAVTRTSHLDGAIKTTENMGFLEDGI